MANFTNWCEFQYWTVDGHDLVEVTADPGKIKIAVASVASSVPRAYVDPGRLAQMLRVLGKNKAADYLANKLPVSKTLRSGDLGEVLCSSFVDEQTDYDLGIWRLRWKDTGTMSMRGEDVLGFALTPTNRLRVLKAESKSRKSMTSAVIEEAREALCANGGLPSPHAMAFVADRLDELGNSNLSAAIINATLKTKLKPTQVKHLLFSFSESDPSQLLANNLGAYAGPCKQLYVRLQVPKHQDFIKSVFSAVRM
jgi:hypothetical protein